MFVHDIHKHTYTHTRGRIEYDSEQAFRVGFDGEIRLNFDSEERTQTDKKNAIIW